MKLVFGPQKAVGNCYFGLLFDFDKNLTIFRTYLLVLHDTFADD